MTALDGRFPARNALVHHLTVEGLVWTLRNHRHLYRAFIALLLLAFLQGCMSWRRVPLEPQGSKERVRVTLKSGELRYLTFAAVQGDSLVSLGAEGIPLEQILSIEVHGVDGARTTFAVLGVASVIALVVGLKALGEGIGRGFGQ